MSRIALSVLISAVFTIGLFAKPYENLVPDFDRRESNAMVRKVFEPTRANLDYAAYNANPVWYDRQKVRPKPKEKARKLEEITFEGKISNPANSLEETPLTKEERENPLAWEPLYRALWDVVKDQGIQTLAGKINGYKWGDVRTYQPYQRLVAVYLHGEGADTELWGRIEFSPWAKNVRRAVTDENKDGYREMYAKIDLSHIPEEAQQKAFEWIRSDYMSRKLNRQEVIDWITALASYWYPTKNTDILENEGTWPDDQTEEKVVKTMDGVTVKDPIAVVRGRPTGDINEPVYNVYVVEGLEAKKKEKGGVLSLDNKQMDTTVSENFKQNNERFAAEAEKHGGYDKWAAGQASFLDAQKEFLAGLPEEQMGFEGKDDFVFFRKSLEYSTGGDLSEQADDKNAIPHLKDLKSYLNSKDVNMLFVVVPVKSEVYYEKLPVDGAPSDKTTIVNPYSRKILADIQDAGIEVIDLLPAFLAAKAEDGEHDEPVYQKQDTHWTNRGLQIAAEKIAERVKQYSWYDDAISAGKVEFTTVDTTFSRQGDIVDKLPQDAQAKYPAVTLKARQVKTPDGELNTGSKAGQVMLIGDSFTGVFEHVDCKGAGVGSHIAAKTDLPVDIITSWGGGPLVRKKMMRARSKLMDGKRLVVYMMVARDLYDYQMGWQPLQTK